MIWNAFLIALREIRRNLTRAFLTVLGVIIGVASVITMVTLGDGTTKALQQQISSLGSNMLMLRPGMGFGPRSSSAGVPNFTLDDVTAIREQITNITAVAPVSSSQMGTIYMQEARSSSITGTTLEYFSINNWTLAEGRYFNDSETVSGAAVGVIGDTVKKELFDDENPIGKKIRVGSAVIEVIGLLKAKGQVGMGDQDDCIIVPINTIQRRIAGRTSTHDIGMICISAEEGSDSDKLVADISSLMRQRRNLQPNQDNDFNVFDTRQISDTLSSSTKTMTTLLAAVAGVSLLVGGIGIMNIMLVSVTERTREIGIRLSIGAMASEVLLQFLVEAITLSCIGGIVGILLALLICLGLSQLIGIPFEFNTQINMISFIFSATIGVLFGYAPARRASQLDPIEALRHE
ncbi:MAG: ABC transporter permease [Opitutales bacterium]|nr:ABC transporter permease [Opitutales bacterium]